MLYFEIIVIFNLIFSTLFSIRLYFERQPGFLEKLFLNDYFYFKVIFPPIILINFIIYQKEQINNKKLDMIKEIIE